MKQEQLDAVHVLWDELTEFDASQPDGAAKHLLQSLCRMTGAVNAEWNGSICMGDESGGDPLEGWRIVVKLELKPLSPEPEGASFLDIQEQWNDREIDPCFLIAIPNAGTFRTYSLRRQMPPEWFDSPFYKRFFGSMGIYDGVMVGFPLNEDAESTIAFYFTKPISDEEIELLAYASRGIRWFHRQQMLSHGLIVADTTVIPIERQVLHLLLTGRSEREIGKKLRRSPNTVHTYVTSLYRKFGVTNRVMLMALWMGQGILPK